MDAFTTKLLDDNGIRLHAEFDGHRGRIIVAIEHQPDGPIPDVTLNGERIG